MEDATTRREVVQVCNQTCTSAATRGSTPAHVTQTSAVNQTSGRKHPLFTQLNIAAAWGKLTKERKNKGVEKAENRELNESCKRSSARSDGEFEAR